MRCPRGLSRSACQRVERHAHGLEQVETDARVVGARDEVDGALGRDRVRARGRDQKLARGQGHAASVRGHLGRE